MTKKVWWRVVAACLAALVSPHAGLGQGRGEVTVRPGLIVMAGVSASADLDVRLSRSISVLGIARGVDEGVDCPAAVSVVPCTADGVSVGGGLRLRSIGMEHLWSFWEVVGGGHRYRADQWYSMVGLGGGVGWSIRERTSMEVGFELRRLGASSPVGAKAHHVVGAMTVKVGLRLLSGG